MGVILVTGPLGSGKTTLIKRLIQFYPQAPLVINDFADFNEDAHRFKKSKVYSVSAGCVCCNKSDELVNTIKGIKSKHILLETTGIAELGPIISLFQKNQISIDLIITLVDSTRVKETPQFNLKNSDVVVLNKIDLVSPESAKRSYTSLKSNSKGTVVKTTRGNISKTVLKQHVYYNTSKGKKHDVSSLTFSSPRSFDKNSLLSLMKKFPRSKGHVLIDGVGYRVDGVHGNIELQKEKTRDSTIVLIGKLDNLKKSEVFFSLLLAQRSFYLSAKQVWYLFKQMD